MKLLRVFCIFLCLSFNAAGQDGFNVEVPKNIVLLKSTRNYNEALAFAKQAAVKLNKKLDLRDNHPNRETGLSLSPGDAKADGYDFPAYLARGDGSAQNDDYISVEYSNAYKGFAKGFYIVVAAITDAGSAAAINQLAKIRAVYPDAYAKRTYVWFGCMH